MEISDELLTKIDKMVRTEILSLVKRVVSPVSVCVIAGYRTGENIPFVRWDFDFSPEGYEGLKLLLPFLLYKDELSSMKKDCSQISNLVRSRGEILSLSARHALEIGPL